MAETSTYLMLLPQISTGLTNTCENELKIKCFPCLYVYHYYDYRHFTTLFLLPLCCKCHFSLVLWQICNQLEILEVYQSIFKVLTIPDFVI